MKQIVILGAVLFVVCASIAYAGDPQPMLIGKWHNDLCSEMEIKSVDAATGLLSGEYRTGVGQPKPSDVYRLTGFVNGDVIAFSVNWGKPVNAGGSAIDSLTSWAGQDTVLETKEEVIKTFWHLAVNIDDSLERENLWKAIWSGGDTFKKGPVPPGCKPQS